MEDKEKNQDNYLKDSGKTQEFSTGAHRDAAKEETSLLPLFQVSQVMNDPVLLNIGMFMKSGNTKYLAQALRESVNTIDAFSYETIRSQLDMEGIKLELPKTCDSDESKKKYMIDASIAHMMLEVAKQYDAGAKKYGKNNWQLGMPVERYLDSGLRHYLKSIRGDKDEAHYRGFVWNLLSAMWTCENMPEFNIQKNNAPD